MRPAPRLLLRGGAVLVSLLALAGTAVASADRPAAPARVGFGAVVLVGDGEVFVGEPANNFRPGTVYVYRKTGGAWQEAARLTAPQAAVGDGFGSALALDGNTLVVGHGTGAVHVFRKQGAAWSHAATVAAEAVGTDGVAAPGAQFGSAMAVSGDWLLVGEVVRGGGGRGGRGGRGGGAAPEELPAGAVYAFQRGADGRYAYRTTLRSPDADSSGDGFGSSVALSGNLALIGAAGQSGRSGVVHEFAVDGGAWERTRSFAPVQIGAGDGFGAALALDAEGERAIVAAPGDGGGHGAVYVMRKAVQQGRGGGGGGQGNIVWQELVRLTAPASTRDDGFAVSLAADATEVWVGAPGIAGVGGVYVYPVDRQGYDPGVVSLLAPSGEAAGFGRSISIRGDVAAVGATALSSTLREGVAIYERDASGAWRPTPMIMAEIDELDPVTGGAVRCNEAGKAGLFDCGSVELQAFLPPSSLTYDGHYIQMNDVWGWTDPQTGNEWAIVGRRDGTTFVDLSNPTGPVPVADLPLTEGARPSAWRDPKVYRDHVYIVSDGAGAHGMQVFDLTRLRTLAPQANGRPSLVEPDVVYTDLNSAHNVVINEESGFAYAVGTSGGGETCAGGLHMIDIREPKSPTFAGCFAHEGTGRSGGGYTHDAQCVMYRGPDTRYSGREICIGANETAISIADVTDKSAPRALSQATYPRVAYAHQGWFSEDQRYWFLDDEIDENQGVERTRTLIWDLTDLENPRLVKEHMGVEATTDHNLYVRGNLMYQANYKSGLRILDVSDPVNPVEVGYIDTSPYIENTPGYQGAWSVYPFFPSGAIAVNSIEQGLFIVRYTPIIP